MSPGDLQVQLGLPELFKACCPKCRQRIRRLVKEKVTDQMVDKVLGAPEVAEGRSADAGRGD